MSGLTQLKTSAQKAIRAKIIEQFPLIEDYSDEVLPKKEAIRIAKCHEHVEIVVGPNGDHLFFRQRDGPFFPSLKIVHKCESTCTIPLKNHLMYHNDTDPFICPLMQVDKGAITFVLAGANVMSPGLTSKGAQMTPGLSIGQIVTIVAEEKEHALGVGVLKMTPEEM